MTAASSSESLQGASFSAQKHGAVACCQRFWYTLLHKLRERVAGSSAYSGARGGLNRNVGRSGLGTYSGVLIPTCENMWGVLIFLRFFYIVGNAGVWQTFLVVLLSFLCALLTTMSLCAVATNGTIEQGGTYYLISRALGPKLGGAVGCMYYLGVLLLSVLEALGSVEMIVFAFPVLDFPSANRVIGAIILIILGTLVFFGIKFVSKLGLGFFAIVLYTMLSYYLGLFLAPRGNVPLSLTGLSWTTFKSNWSPGYTQGKSFSSAVSLFFPCFTGILSGADRATSLRKPEKSIPRGTIGAVVLSFLMYLSYMGLWAAVGTRDYLLGDSGGTNGLLMVVKDIAFPLSILTELGIIVASIAQAMQCLIISPRLLQAIAGDGVVPFLETFAKTSKNGEPRKALVLTTMLCVAAAMIGSLNLVAPLVSICFLTSYSALNLSCFILSIVNAPSWRPKWKYYHWSAAFVGFVFCAGLQFVIVWYWALGAIILLIFIYAYIDFRQVEVNWGTGLGGLRLQIAVHGILSVGDEARYTVNWRPQLLCLSKPHSLQDDNGHSSHQFLSLASQLKKGQGLCVVTVILEGKLEETSAQTAAERIELENCMSIAKVTGFAKVLVAPTFRVGKTYAIQSSGLGSLEPNTLVMGWPSKWREEGHENSAEILLETLAECKAVDKAVLLCMHVNQFPSIEDPQEGVIDVWWIVHDGGLLLLLAHLLQQHKIWRKCRIRVHTVAEKLDNSEQVADNLKKLLEQVRIEAEVQVLELDEADLAPYTFDYTLRKEEAQAFANEVAKFRRNGSRKKGSPQRDNQKVGGERIKDAMPNSQLNQLDGGTKDIWERHVPHPDASDMPELTLDCPKFERGLSEKKVRQLQVIPTFLPHGEGTSKSSPCGHSGKGVMSKQALKVEDPETNATPLQDNIVSGVESSATSSSMVSRKGKAAGKEKARWADDAGYQLAEIQNSNLEILVDNGSLPTTSDGADIEEGQGGDLGDKEVHASSSQVYPGSPAKMQPTHEIPKPMKRTWEVFSQSYSAKKLNEMILEQSRGAQLILINLPDHYEGMEPARFMEYCEELADGLEKVLLIHGTGKELWGIHGQGHHAT